MHNKTLGFIAAGVMFLASIPAAAAVDPGYAGSAACQPCHEQIYRQWKITPHARFMRDARRDPSIIAATDFSEEWRFKKEDIHFILGCGDIQRYLALREGRYFVFPMNWDISEGKWWNASLRSMKDWETKDPWETTCAGCHTVGFDPKSGGYAEISIGCEACHGPGKKHTENGNRDAVINPARLDTTRRDMICEACHTQGKDRATQTVWGAIGFRPGSDLREYYTDWFMPVPHSKGWYWGDLSYTERHRMFLVVQIGFLLRDRTVSLVEPWFGREEEYKRFQSLGQYLSPSERCGRCHLKTYQAFNIHSGHAESQAECQDCHTPTLTRDGTRYSVHDHKFDYSRPLPIPCDECHGPKLLDPEGKPLRGADGVLAAEPPSHAEFPFTSVKIPRTLSRTEACLRCHDKKDAAWVEASVASILEKRKNAPPPGPWLRRWR